MTNLARDSDDSLGLAERSPSPRIPALDADVDNLAAGFAYANAGLYILPVKPGTKHPGSRVGNRWQTKSSRDHDLIAAWFAAADDGIAIDLGRSDLVVIDVDHPELLPAWLQSGLTSWGAPYQSTRPDSPGRGHYVFHQPPGHRIGCSKGLLADMGLDVKGDGGVIITQPTQHPEGGEYRWITPGDIPVLPLPLAEMAGDTAKRESGATEVEVAEFLAAHIGNERPSILLGWRKHFIAATAKLNSRHDTMVPIVAGAMEEAMAGYFPAADADTMLRKMFVDAKTAPYNGKSPIGLKAADHAFDGILGWAVGQAKNHTVSKIRERVERKMPASPADDMLSIAPLAADVTQAATAPAIGQAAGIGYSSGEREAATAPGVSNLIELEQDFWDSRDSLRSIYTVSLKRMCSPWAVLGCCVARVLAQIHPHVLLPDIFGEFGSLNWFGAIAAASGGGKGNANGLARRLVGEVPHTCNLGSGEGMVDAFWRLGKDDKGKRTVDRIHQVMFNANEIDNMAALGSRSGSTLMATIRSAFSGEELGFTNRKNNDTLPGIDAHTYRLTFLCSVQPGRARALLGDADGGTPQRFMWLPARDSRRNPEAYDRGYPVPRLALPPATAWQYRTEIAIPDEAEREIVVAQADDSDNPLDSHAMFAREKFAFALAVLGSPEMFTGRGAEMTAEDWRLSGIAAAVSAATRAEVEASMARTERGLAAEAGSLYGHKLAAAKVAEAGENLARDNRIAALIEKHLVKAGDDGLTDRELHDKMASRDKPFWRKVADALIEQRRVTHTSSVDGTKGKDTWRAVR